MIEPLDKDEQMHEQEDLDRDVWEAHTEFMNDIY